MIEIAHRPPCTSPVGHLKIGSILKFATKVKFARTVVNRVMNTLFRFSHENAREDEASIGRHDLKKHQGNMSRLRAAGKWLLDRVRGIDPTGSEHHPSNEDEESRESAVGELGITAPTSPTEDLASNVGELGSSLSVESQQASSVVTESAVLENDLVMEDEQDHFREQAVSSATEGKRDRIQRILRYIEDGAGNNTHSQHKRHAIVLGLTGSGKSTTINSLAGCKLRRVTEEEADRLLLSRDALVVASGDQRGGRKEATKIGNRIGKSQTEVLQAVAMDENDEAVDIFFLILIMSKTVLLESN